MKKNNTTAEIAAALRGASRILVLSHYNPDADAYGSSCALALGLRAAGKHTRLVNETGIVARYDFIPGVREVTNSIPVDGFDLLVTCDCGDLKRVGDTLVETVSKLPCVINIDHHISNDYFGHYNLVRPDASSASEIVYDVLAEMGIALNAEMAFALFTGINGDTGSFRYSNTTARVLEIAAQLVRAGAQPVQVAQSLYSRNSLASVRLQSEALASMRMHAGGRLALVVVPADQFVKHGATGEDTESLVERARDIDGVLISVCARQEQGLWKVSMRSKDAAYDLSKVAEHFGGGGHKMAAAFRWRKEFPELERQLTEMLIGLLGA